MKKSNRQKQHEKLVKSLGKWKKQEKKSDIQIKKEIKIVYKVLRQRDLSKVEKIVKSFIVIQKRQNLHHSTITNLNHKIGKLDIHTYNVMKYSFKRQLAKMNVTKTDEELDILIQNRVKSTERMSARTYLKKEK